MEIKIWSGGGMLAVLENANTARTQVCTGSNPVLTTKQLTD